MTDELPAQAPAFSHRWIEAVQADPDAPFLQFEAADGSISRWTYGAFEELVARVAGTLAAAGAGPGARVHLALANCPAFVAVWLACGRLGASMVPSDPRSTTREIAVHLERTRPAVGICATAREDVYRAAVPAGMTAIAVAEDGEIDPRLLAGGAAVAPAEVGGGDEAAILFTSGTTSTPKGVVITQANYAFVGDVMAGAARLSSRDRFLVVLPLFHANAQYYCFAAAIAVGASVALTSGFSASRFLAQAARHEATHVSLFAAPIRMILARGAEPVEGLRVRHAWYAQRLTEDEYARFAALLGCRPRELYGMTETMAAVLSGRETAGWREAIGGPTVGCRVALLPPVDADAAADGEAAADPGLGEIAVAGRRGVELFAGYLDDPQTTEAAFEGAWFRTGDLGRLDDRGDVLFAGRRGEFLKVSGENVSVIEVESVLTAHAGVMEAAVVGRPDPVRDEVPVAFVVPADGARLEPAALLAHCAERLAPAKRPVDVRFVDELPRTSVGKIKKYLLRREAQEG